MRLSGYQVFLDANRPLDGLGCLGQGHLGRRINRVGRQKRCEPTINSGQPRGTRRPVIAQPMIAQEPVSVDTAIVRVRHTSCRGDGHKVEDRTRPAVNHRTTDMFHKANVSPWR